MDFMAAAIKEAKKGITSNYGGPFGAVIVKDNKIIARAHNEVIKNNDPTAHAEILVIRKAAKKLKNFNLEGCTLYTTCYPCPMCLAAILWARIQVVYFGCTALDAKKISFDDKKFYDFFQGKNRSLLSLRELQKNECQAVFAAWEKKNDKQLY
jgi:guanine deaminase